MILNIVVDKKDEKLTYASFLRKYFLNELVQDVLMGAETDFDNGVISFDVIDPSPEFLKELRTDYPEHMLIQ